MLAVTDLLSFLSGSWVIERRIDDARSGLTGCFTGEGLFVPAQAADGLGGRGLSYTETGELIFGTHRGQASRRLRYLGLSGGMASVHFADGRPFFELDLSAGRCRAEHGCGADRYEMTTLVVSEDLLEEEWVVEGPAKSYTARATLWRESPSSKRRESHARRAAGRSRPGE